MKYLIISSLISLRRLFHSDKFFTGLPSLNCSNGGKAAWASVELLSIERAQKKKTLNIDKKGILNEINGFRGIFKILGINPQG